MRMMLQCCKSVLSIALILAGVAFMPGCGSKEVAVDEVLGRPLTVDPEAGEAVEGASPIPEGGPIAPGTIESGPVAE